jgi:hypothetical protein
MALDFQNVYLCVVVFVFMSVCLSVCLYVCQFLCHYVCLSACPYARVSGEQSDILPLLRRRTLP